MTPTHYDVLGIAVDADEAEVRAAFRMRARALHPDAGGNAGDMRAVNEAWHVLGDRQRRAAYNVEIGQSSGRRPDDRPISDEGPELWADLVAASMTEDPPAATRPSDLITLVPPALFALAIVSFAVGVAIGSAPLLAVFLGALFASGAGFLLAPFFAMTRARRR